MVLGWGAGRARGRAPRCKWFVSASGVELPYLVCRHRARSGMALTEGGGRRGRASEPTKVCHQAGWVVNITQLSLNRIIWRRALV